MKYKNHEIKITSTSTDVYIPTSIGYRKAVRSLYKVIGDHSSPPAFTSIKAAKEWITNQIKGENK